MCEVHFGSEHQISIGTTTLWDPERIFPILEDTETKYIFRTDVVPFSAGVVLLHEKLNQ